ncbi:hypothetical protein ANCDUO_03327 [Ancylostoma duodenale]|uniref:Uncharacterized protein n=1 Tax=Ancylostoma duodenale TaxID=51022 RepID=A0A0C2DU87_9BILA|nr:hypothetical protein ANCDUO_03327 [Ancylostoma duodenale]
MKGMARSRQTHEMMEVGVGLLIGYFIAPAAGAVAAQAFVEPAANVTDVGDVDDPGDRSGEIEDYYADYVRDLK